MKVVMTELEGPVWAGKGSQVLGDMVVDVGQCGLKSDAQAAQKADVVGAVEGVGDAKGTCKSGDFLGVRGENLRSEVGSAGVAGADCVEADVCLEAALASIGCNGGVHTEGDIPLAYVAGGGAGDVEGNAVVEDAGTDSCAEGDAQDPAGEGFECGDVVCGGVGVGGDYGRSCGGEARAGKEIVEA